MQETQGGVLGVSRDMRVVWDTICNFLTANGLQLLINIVTAAIIFFVGRWIAGVVSSLLEKILNRTHVDTTLSKFIRNLSYFSILVYVTIAALTKLGLDTKTIVTVVGAAGLAIGLALQGSLSNFGAGILLVIFKPFRVGDFVEISNVKGTVQEIQIFSTVLHTVDNVRIVIPNSQVTGGHILNYTANDKRRVDMVIGVSYGDDLSKAKQIITSVLLGDNRVLRSPDPVVAVSELAESSVNLVVRPWVKTDDYWPTYFDLTEKIKLALEAGGLTIPFPQRDVHVYNEQPKH